jgi:hypothetical protein
MGHSAIFSALLIVAVATSSTAAAKGGGRGGSYSSKSYGTGSTSSHSVRGYVTKNGVYVPPHRATNPNNTKLDNWSTKRKPKPVHRQAGNGRSIRTTEALAHGHDSQRKINGL